MSAALGAQCRATPIAGCSNPSVVSGGVNRRAAVRRVGPAGGKGRRLGVRDVALRVTSEGRGDMAAGEPSFNDFGANASLPSSIGVGSKGSDPTNEDNGVSKRGRPTHAISQTTAPVNEVISADKVTSNIAAIPRIDAVASTASSSSTPVDSLKPETPSPYSRTPVDMADVQCVVLAGGMDDQNPLLRERARGALRIAASYRLIDFPLSNLLNSKARQVYVLTQFNSFSLNSHITNSFPPEVFGMGRTPGFVDVLPTYQTQKNKEWATGSADVLRRHLESGTLMQQHGQAEADAYLVISGEALYQMDYRQMLDEHNQKGADITIAIHEVQAGDVTGLGVVASEPAGRVYNFKEKPTVDEIRKISDCGPQQPLSECSLNASMGVYIFSHKAMKELVETTNHNSLGDVIPVAITQPDRYRVYAHKFQGNWTPIRTLREWFDTNLSLTAKPASDSSLSLEGFCSGKSAVWTKARFLPPARFRGESEIVNSITSDGSITRGGCFIKDSIVGPSALLGKNVTLERCIVTGYPGSIHGKDSRSEPDIGNGSVLKEVVCDGGCTIGENCILTNEAGVQDLDKSEEGYVIHEGIITVLKGATIPDGTVI